MAGPIEGGSTGSRELASLRDPACDQGAGEQTKPPVLRPVATSKWLGQGPGGVQSWQCHGGAERVHTAMGRIQREKLDKLQALLWDHLTTPCLCNPEEPGPSPQANLQTVLLPGLTSQTYSACPGGQSHMRGHPDHPLMPGPFQLLFVK